MATIVIRVISPACLTKAAGRSRVEMPPSDTIGNLRAGAEIAKRLGLGLGVDAKAPRGTYAHPSNSSKIPHRIKISSC